MALGWRARGCFPLQLLPAFLLCDREGRGVLRVRAGRLAVLTCLRRARMA